VDIAHHFFCFATPAEFPLHDCSSYRLCSSTATCTRESVGFFWFLSPVPNPNRLLFSITVQVHTTGMDIKQHLNACAVLTLGKDMTFREYAQGASSKNAQRPTLVAKHVLSRGWRRCVVRMQRVSSWRAAKRRHPAGSERRPVNRVTGYDFVTTPAGQLRSVTG
jgi:hypothetical protein